MTRADLVKRIAFRLGNLKNQDELIKAEIAATITRLENDVFHPWFLLSENNTYSMQKGENRIPLPVGFLMEYEEGALYIKQEDGGWGPLAKKSQDLIKANQLPVGRPSTYALTNEYFRVFPTPDKEYLLEMLFYRRTDPDRDDNPWYLEASDWVIYETCFTIFLAKGDKRAGNFKQLSTEQKLILQAKHDERIEVNYDEYVGGDW